MTSYPENIAVTLDQLITEGNRVTIPGILPRRRLHTLLSGQHASLMRGRGLDFEEVRQYRRGDDVKDIDWKVTARTQKTHIKVYNEEKERPAMILVDQCSDLFFGSVRYVKSVQSAMVAAIAAFGTLKRKDRVGGLILEDQVRHFIRPQRSQKAVLRILNLITEANQRLPSSAKIINGNERLGDALLEMANFVDHDYSVFIVTDAGKLTTAAKKHLALMARHNDLILIHISDPLDSKLPPENWLFTDGEMQVYRKKKEADMPVIALDELRDELIAYRIPLVEITTEKNVMEQFIEIVQQVV